MNNWTQREVDYLIENYDQVTAYQIAKELNRNPRKVYRKAAELGLKKYIPKVKVNKQFAALLKSYNNATVRANALLCDISDAPIAKFNPKPKSVTTGCNVVIGINRVGLRQYDYQRKLNQQFKRAA